MQIKRCSSDFRRRGTDPGGVQQTYSKGGCFLMKKLNPHLRMGLLFGAIIGVFFSMQHGIIFGILLGVAGGALFGFIFWIYSKTNEKGQVKKLSSFRAEFAKLHDILYETTATCLMRGITIEGRLYLTTNGLFFKSQKANADTSELWIHYESMKSLSRQEHRGSIGEGLVVTQEDRRQIKFVVPDADIWLGKIQPFVPQKVLFRRDKG